MSEKEPATPQDDALQTPLAIRMVMSRFVPSVCAHHMAIQPTEEGVVMSFYEIIPPVVTDPETVEQLKKNGIPAECVARITVSDKRFIEFARLVSKIAARLEDKA